MGSLKRQIAKLPEEPGVYKFFDKNGKLIYVGKSVSIKKRAQSYFVGKDLGPKTNKLVQNITSIDYIKVFSEFEALLLESELIRENKPFYNVIAKDDKSPLYIKITSDEIPLIQTTRKEKPVRGIFLKGPFPNTKTTREILKMTRRIFPYCVHKNPGKPCLYVHLGLCPYPYRDGQTKQEYVSTIVKIKKLLSGKSKSLLRDLVHGMKDLSKLQKYEDAAAAKKQIENLQYLMTTYHTPREFMEQPTLVDDLTLTRLKDFQRALNLPKLPKRIECYDISNISGTDATGSMVVMTNGKIDKGEYRRFKIKFSSTPNDYEMMREVLARRIKNNWPKPDVMIIDGGRGQLNAVLSILNKYKYQTTVISLAKRLEEIYTSGKIRPISLPKESPARQLAQEIRDEAHRFAITYHRKLRSKAFIKT
ncbi:MAG: excinuclease ABC subunit UvrC [Candidatus Curtissbacteria bacterium]|nr:excinuclease ABC subunit UvrC [Candidatus Curtissbacteria bacterium]